MGKGEKKMTECNNQCNECVFTSDVNQATETIQCTKEEVQLLSMLRIIEPKILSGIIQDLYCNDLQNLSFIKDLETRVTQLERGR